jgi:hypothetical protein
MMGVGSTCEFGIRRGRGQRLASVAEAGQRQLLLQPRPLLQLPQLRAGFTAFYKNFSQQHQCERPNQGGLRDRGEYNRADYT